MRYNGLLSVEPFNSPPDEEHINYWNCDVEVFVDLVEGDVVGEAGFEKRKYEDDEKVGQEGVEHGHEVDEIPDEVLRGGQPYDL